MRPVVADEVELGSPLAWSVYDREGKLLFVQGMVLTSQAHVDLVLERGMLVPDTATTAGVLLPEFDHLADDTQDAADDVEEDGPPAEPEPPVFREMQKLRRELRALHDELLQRSGEPLTERLFELALRLRALVARDADAALAAMQLEVGDDGQVARLLHAATLCELLVRAREWDEVESLSVIAAALTYDVALNPFADAMNQQQTELSADQRLVIAGHPQAGVELLQEAGVEDPVWLAAVLQHHERIDGSGYPNGLSGDAISRGARKLAIADIYSAMVRPRAYREAVHARHALRSLFLERGKAVDESLASLLVREIGVFPPGTPVRLANGEVGVVLRRGRGATRPIVARLINANGTLAALAAQRDSGLPEYAITETVPPRKYQALVASASELWCSERTLLRP
ncbi:MAG TPA: HD domain-containing phosphohydrolase [Lysobacter sp.]|nr:HD domain-containing phosphohydrolase [Lysobacter sp.]